MRLLVFARHRSVEVCRVAALAVALLVAGSASSATATPGVAVSGERGSLTTQTGGIILGDAIGPLTACPAPTLPFNDIDTVISTADIACIYGLGITTGTSPTTFAPNDPVNRDHMATFLARLWRATGN